MAGPLPAAEIDRRRRGLLTLLSSAPVEVLERELGSGRPLTVRQPVSGVIAHYQGRPDLCYPAAASTLLQLAYDEVPDPQIDARVSAGEDPDTVNAEVRAAWHAWLSSTLGLREVVSAQPPDYGGWLGATASIPGERFSRHVVVCCSSAPGRWHIVHDPASNFPTPIGYKVAPVRQQDIITAITFAPLEENA